MAFKLFNLRY